MSRTLEDGNSRIGMATRVYYSSYVGRVTGAILGGAGVKMGINICIANCSSRRVSEV